MAGSCISASGVRDFWKYLINSSLIFQHDNDPKNTANTVKTYWIEKYTIEHHQSLTGPLKSSTLLKQYEITLTENLKENNRYVNTILKTSRNLNNLGFFFSLPVPNYSASNALCMSSVSGCILGSDGWTSDRTDPNGSGVLLFTSFLWSAWSPACSPSWCPLLVLCSHPVGSHMPHHCCCKPGHCPNT